MGKILLALPSFIMMLCLPAWLDGRVFPVLHQSNFKQIATYTEPYHELIKKVDDVIRPKKQESIIVSTWQDSEGNVHFSNQGQAPAEAEVQNYEVKSLYTGRFAFPQQWIWASMFCVWLVFYISSLLCFNMLSKLSPRTKQARTIGVGDRDQDSKDKRTDQFIEFENKNSMHNRSGTNNNAVAYAHRILGTNANSSPEEIKSAYHGKMKQYHPDKVAHLGQELQDVARKKATDINRAYAILVK